jgi:hypothetical protein
MALHRLLKKITSGRNGWVQGWLHPVLKSGSLRAPSLTAKQNASGAQSNLPGSLVRTPRDCRSQALQLIVELGDPEAERNED